MVLVLTVGSVGVILHLIGIVLVVLRVHVGVLERVLRVLLEGVNILILAPKLIKLGDISLIILGLARIFKHWIMPAKIVSSWLLPLRLLHRISLPLSWWSLRAVRKVTGNAQSKG